MKFRPAVPLSDIYITSTALLWKPAFMEKLVCAWLFYEVKQMLHKFRTSHINVNVASKYSAGVKLAQKFREKCLLPPDKTGRSFIG